MTIKMAWGLDYPDAENVLQLYYGPNSSPGSNDSNYDNPEFNKLYEETSVMLPSKERSEIYKKMHKILLDDAVMIAGYSQTQLWIWHKNVLVVPTESIPRSYFKYVAVK
jgi:ABC-type transport system substrate-binding protein